MDEKQLLEKFANALGVKVDQITVEQKVEQLKSEKPNIKCFSEMFSKPTYRRTKKLVEKKQLPVQTEVQTNNAKIIIEHKIKQ